MGNDTGALGSKVTHYNQRFLLVFSAINIITVTAYSCP